MVLQGAAQPHEGHQEQEDAHADDPRHHPDAGDQVEPFPPGCHSDQQQTHQLSRKKTEWREEGSAINVTFLRKSRLQEEKADAAYQLPSRLKQHFAFPKQSPECVNLKPAVSVTQTFTLV